MFWKGHDRSEKGAVYGLNCPDQQGARTVWIADGQAADAAPVIDPEAVARRAVASMRLEPPAVASPRAAGTYVVGMPMWMWATPSPTTFGPATATAGGVTVTAKVTRVRWARGDGTTVTCHGPGTPYAKSRGKASSPDCGHLYERPSYTEPGGRFQGAATAAWTVTWIAAGRGDKAYSSRANRAYLRRRGIRCTIPEPVGSAPSSPTQPAGDGR